MHTKDTISLQKRQSVMLSYIYRDWAKETGSDTLAAKAERVANCSNYWTGFRCPDCGRLHHMVSYGCRDRLCPTCAAKLARATAAQALQAMAVMELDSDLPANGWALVTLTQANVPGYLLSAEIDKMLEAWALLRHLRPVKRVLLAWARNIEITYNSSTNTYHPHIHCIVCVKDTALASAEGAAAKWWADRWAECMDLAYTPVCNVSPLKDHAAVFEVSKYVCKMSSVFSQSLPAMIRAEVVRTIATAIHGRRLKSYGGKWLKVRRALNQRPAEELDDLQMADLADGMEERCTCGSSESLVPCVLVWAGMEYKEVTSV